MTSPTESLLASGRAEPAASPPPAPGTTPRVLSPPGKVISISLDLDNLWSYMKTHGDPGWESFPSYLDTVCPIVVDCMKRHGLTITVFVVGQDAAIAANGPALRAIAEAGHEIGNHSFKHEPWLHRYSAAEIEEEIRSAEEHIERATGKRPHGFRGPGFSMSAGTLRVLQRRGYFYDASTFPTFLGPLARAYYFWSTRGLPKVEIEKRKKLFGTASEGFRSIRPYTWDVDGGRLVEIPVTTMPILRVPIHLSYLIYLAKFSMALCHTYLRTAVTLLKLTGAEPSFLLHPLDFLGGDKVKELSFFPGMSLSTDFKLRLFDQVIEHLKKHFTPVTMEAHARAIAGRAKTPLKPLPAEVRG